MAEKKQNRLATEKSPYLLQHADNPVNWFPWCDEAFEKARAEDKPVFLSIGYSTCHWCHVMAHESFEDPEIAALMNDTFISIKVDREERPDIDMLYMSVCQMMTGSGGWPLTMVMTPDRQPFFAATYIPRETKYGRIGLRELIPRIRELWTQRREAALSSARQITAALRQTDISVPGEELGESALDTAFEQLAGRFDSRYGGFGGAPKFPTPHNLLFLMRYWKRNGKPEALNMVETTLRAMRNGGIYDHIGFGFHRYSTDGRWLVPHFEKMLYDQALLAMAYLEAYQATRNEIYAQTAQEIFTYVLRDMTAPEGGIYSAEDADSEGAEGKFYLWRLDEIRKLLPVEDAELFSKIFNIRDNGNFGDEVTGETISRNILHLSGSLEETAVAVDMTVEELRKRIETMRCILFDRRQKRVHPHKDTKILTNWNGLMVAALARGGRVLNVPEYTSAARKAADFVLNQLVTPDGRLMHRYRDGEAAFTANLDDYAFFIHGLLELYEATFDVAYLENATALNAKLMKHFWDDENEGFFFTADDAEKLPARQKEIYDGAIPSGNSMEMLNLLRLSRMTGDYDLEEKAIRIGKAFSEKVAELPLAYTQLLVAIDFAVGPSYEVVIAGRTGAKDIEAMLQAVNESFIPNKILIRLDQEAGTGRIEHIAPFISGMSDGSGKARAYVCVNHACQQPTSDIKTMLKLLAVDCYSYPITNQRKGGAKAPP